MSKLELLESLYSDYKKEFEGEQMVFWSGDSGSSLVLIGEAPGKDEVRLCEPFVGKAGKNLSEFLELLSLSRRDIYITNAVKYRLAAVNPKTGRVSNRPATRQDIERNRSYLLKELEIINPRYIVTLGNVALRAVTGERNLTIGAVHGQTMRSMTDSGDCILFPLYHPASIIYNRSLKTEYINDITKLASILGDTSGLDTMSKPT